VDAQSKVRLDRPRSIRELIVDSLALYLRLPILFLALAAVVVVPYELLLLLATGDGPLALGRTGFLVSNLISLIDSFLVTSVISALHIHAIREVGDGAKPRFVSTVRQSLPTLLVVALAVGVSSFAILIGLLALAVPGLLLMAQWAVVAQTAALDGGGWRDALRRSAELTSGYRRHAFGLVFVAGLIALAPNFALGAVFGRQVTTAGSFLAGTGMQIVTRSFEAVATALLYYDLQARPRIEPGQVPEWDPTVPSFEAPPGVGDPLTPDGYTDATRPRGWYIDPEDPGRMRYWAPETNRSGANERRRRRPRRSPNGESLRRARCGGSLTARAGPGAFCGACGGGASCGA
jgi:hypothetical protein